MYKIIHILLCDYWNKLPYRSSSQFEYIDHYDELIFYLFLIHFLLFLCKIIVQSHGTWHTILLDYYSSSTNCHFHYRTFLLLSNRILSILQLERNTVRFSLLDLSHFRHNCRTHNHPIPCWTLVQSHLGSNQLFKNNRESSISACIGFQISFTIHQM